MKNRINIIVKRYVALVLAITMLPFQEMAVSAVTMPFSVENTTISENNPAGNWQGDKEPVVPAQNCIVDSDWKLMDDEYVARLWMTEGTLDLNGHTLVVQDSLIQAGGTIRISGGKLLIMGDYRIQNIENLDDMESVTEPEELVTAVSDGILCMNDEDDYVSVSGNFITDSTQNHTGKLTAGTLAVYGNFTQLATKNRYNFISTEEHKLLLCGDEPQQISFAFSNVSQSRIANLELAKKHTYRLVGTPCVTGRVIDHSGEMEMYEENEKEQANAEKEETVIEGDLVIGASTVFEDGYYSGSLTLVENHTFAQPLLIGGDLKSNSMIQIQSDLTVLGDFTTSRSIKIDNAVLQVGGDFTKKYTIYSDYGLDMDTESDRMIVSGNFIYDNYNYVTNRLTAGTIQVQGDFSVTRGFKASGAHKVILNGDKKQTVTMAEDQKFATLELQNDSEEGVVFKRPFLKDNFIRNGCRLTYLFGEDAVTEGSFGWTLHEDMVWEGDLILLDDVLDLNGYSLTVEGNLLQRGGEVRISKGSLHVKGNYAIEGAEGGASSGILKMTNQEDKVLVEGDFLFRTNASHENRLTDGVLEIKGDCNLYKTTVSKSFYPTNNHRVVLSGKGHQSVYFEEGKITDDSFANIRFANTSREGITLSGICAIRGEISNDKECNIQGEIGIGQKTTFKEDYYMGDVCLLEKYNFQKPLTIAGNLKGVRQYCKISADLTVTGNMTDEYWVQMYNATLCVGGDFIMQKSSSYTYGLYMEHDSDLISVSGNFVCDMYSTNGITAGILEVKGDFTATKGFQASGNHKVILSGDKKQTLNMAEDQKFAVLEIRNYSSDGIECTNRFVKDKLIRNGCHMKYLSSEGEFGWILQEDTVWDGDLVLLEDVLDLNGHTLRIKGNLIQKGGEVCLSNGKLYVEGDYRMEDSTEEELITASTGLIRMVNAGDYICVDGDLVIRTNASHEKLLTNGTLEVKGNFYVYKTIQEKNFYPTENHTFILSGTDAQKIYIEDGKIDGASFQNLQFKNTSEEGITLSGICGVRGEISAEKDGVILGEIGLGENTTFKEDYYQGDVCLLENYNFQKPFTIAGNLRGDNRSCKIFADLTVMGDVTDEFWVAIDNATLSVGGDFIMQKNSYTTYGLYMEHDSDQVNVSGNFVYDLNRSGITAGILEVKGDFTAKRGFIATGKHKVILSGDRKQTVDMAEGQSFAVLELKNTSKEGVYSKRTITRTEIITNGCPLHYENMEGIWGFTMQEDLTVEGDMVLLDGTMDLNGHRLTVTGDLIQAGGDMKVNGGELYVKGSYYIQYRPNTIDADTDKAIINADLSITESSGRLLMQQETDMVRVEGDFILQPSKSIEKWFTEGTLIVAGDFKQLGNKAFASQSSHKLVLNGNGYQQVIFNKPANISQLSLENTSAEGINLTGTIYLADTLEDNGAIVSGTASLYVDTVDRLTDGRFGGNLILQKDSVLSRDIEIGGELRVVNNLDLNGHKLQVGELSVERECGINGGSLFINGDFYLLSYGKLVMTNPKDYVLVIGKMTYISRQSHEGFLTDGILELRGDFEQYYYDTFIATENHKTILEKKTDASGRNYVQNITFNIKTNSRFHTLILRKMKDTGYIFSAPVEELADEVIEEGVDETPPTPITSLVATTISCNSVTLSYDGARDAYGIAGYYIYRDGKRIAVTGKKTYTDTGLIPDKTYEYKVYAYDVYKNISQSSEPLSVTTLKDSEIPSAVTGLEVNRVTGSAIYLEWNPAVDNGKIVGYNIYRDGKIIAENVKETLYKDSDILCNAVYNYTVTALDSSGNESLLSESVEGAGFMPKILSVSPDDQADIGGNEVELSVKFKDFGNSKGNKVSIAWQENADENWHEITPFPLSQETINKQTLGAHMVWDISTFEENKMLDIRYRVTDEDGNESDYIATYYLDKTGPAKVKNLMAENEGGSLRITWDKSKSSDCQGYYIYRMTPENTWKIIDTIAGRDRESYLDTTVTAGEEYSYCVRGYDRFMQLGEISDVISGVPGEDTTVPQILSVTPEEILLKGQALIRVSAKDNDRIGQIKLYIQRDGEQERTLIAERAFEEQSVFASFVVDTTAYKDGSYLLYVEAVDDAGNLSEAFQKYYLLDNTGIGKIKFTDCNTISTAIQLNWEDVQDSDFAYFAVEQKQNGIYQEIAQVPDSLSYIYESLTPETSYTFRVVGYDKAGNRGAESDEITLTTTADTISPVINSVSPGEEETFNKILPLQMTVADNYALGKAVFRWSTDGKEYNTLTEIAETIKRRKGKYTYNWDVSTLPEGKVYVHFSALDEAGNQNAPASDGEIIVTYVIDHTPPEKVKNLTATGEEGRITLVWEKAEEAAFYHIYRAENNGIFTLLQEKITANSYYDTEVVSGKSYTYYVVAVDKAGNECEASAHAEAICQPDRTPPEITGVSPSDEEVLGHKSSISVLAIDNSKMAKIRMEYREKGSSESFRKLEETKTDGRSCYASFSMEEELLAEDTVYEFRFLAVDETGNVSEYVKREYTFDLTAPAKPGLVAKSGSFQIELSWEANSEKDFLYYKIYRRAYGTQKEECILTTKDNHYEDKNVEPDSIYFYRVEAYDTLGNSVSSDIKNSYANTVDTEAPVAELTMVVTGYAGEEIEFDGTLSRDNVRITSYAWDFGDGSIGKEAKIRHVYAAEGNYQVTLTVKDAMGHMSKDTTTVMVRSPEQCGETTIQIVDTSGKMIPHAYVFVKNARSEENIELRTNEDGTVNFVGADGLYNVAAYAEGYVPQENTFEVIKGKEETLTITLVSGEVTAGELTCRRMELDEMIERGVDLSDPNNYHTYVFSVELIFCKEPLPVIVEWQEEGIPSEANMNSGSQGPGRPAGNGKGKGKGIYNITTVVGENEQPKPTLAIMSVEATASWLKEMYSVDLSVINLAGNSFTIEQTAASLNLPDGVSLVETPSSSALQQLGTIHAGEVKTASWVVRGDESGSYKVSADLSGSLMPFGTTIFSTFEADMPITVSTGEGLHVYVQPENAYYIGQGYYIYFSLANESDRIIYNMKLKVGSLEGTSSGSAGSTGDGSSGGGSPEEGEFVSGGQTSNGSGAVIIQKPDIPSDDHGSEVELIEISCYNPESRTVNIIRNKNGIDYVLGMVSGNGMYGSSENSLVTASVPVTVGDSVEIGTFYPGAAINLVYKCSPRFGGDPEKEYYRLTDAFIKEMEGANKGVKVTLETVPSHVPEYLRYRILTQSEYYGDPVSMINGGFIQDISTLSVKGADEIALNLTYNSLLAKYNGEGGHGFTHNYEQYITDEGSWITLHKGAVVKEKFINRNVAEGKVTGTVIGDNAIFVEEKLIDEEAVTYYDPVSEDMEGCVLEKSTDGYLLTMKSGEKMTFDEYGFLTGITGEAGRHTTVSWVKNDMLITEDISGEQLRLCYDKKGHIANVKDNHGREVKLTYDKEENLIGVTDALGNKTNYCYDAYHRMTSVINAAGITTVQNSYDEFGRVLTQIEADRGRPSVFSYQTTEEDGCITTVTDHLGVKSTVESDAKGNVIREVNGRGKVTTYTYQNRTNLTETTDGDGNKTSYTYDEDGNVTTVTDPQGNTMRYVYDEDGNVTEIISGEGHKSTYTYDERGLQTTYTNPLGSCQERTYDQNGMILSQTEEGLGTIYYGYTGGRLEAIVDASGSITRLTYDEYGNIASSTDGEGNRTEWIYDAAGNLRAEIYPDGRRTDYTYDCLNQVIKQVETGKTELSWEKTKPREKTFAYDKAGRMISETDSLGRTTSYSYDGEDNLLQVINPDGTRENSTYDKAGNLSTETAANGLQTIYESDSRGNVTKLQIGNQIYRYELFWNGKIKKVTNPDGSSISYTYDKDYNCTGYTDAMGNTYLSSYDAMGNLLKETDPLGNTISYSYDKTGRLLTETDANGHTTSYTYDENGNITGRTDAIGTKTQMDYDKCNRMTDMYTTVSGKTVSNRFVYDSCGRLVKIIDAKGAESVISYNAFGETEIQNDETGTTVLKNSYDDGGRVTDIRDATGSKVSYTYDVADRVRELKTAVGTEQETKTIYSYDTAGNHATTTDGENGTAKAIYDLYGNLLSRTDAMGNKTSYTYDSMNRCVTETNALGKTANYRYNKNGQLAEHTDFAGNRTIYTYDKAGRLIGEKKGLFNTSYTYDKAGNLLTVTDNTGTIRRTYDALNRVTQVTDYNGKTIKYKYDELGNRVEITYPGGKAVRYTWDECQNLTSVTDTEGNKTTYRYDVADRLTETIRGDGSSEERSYDEAGRLTAITDRKKSGEILRKLEYNYDYRGNISSIIEVEGTKNAEDAELKALQDFECTYGTDNRLKTFNGETVTYDSNGNMTHGPVDDQMAELSYDAYDRLIRVIMEDGSETLYTYDAENIRMKAEHTEADGTTWEETYVTDRETTYSQLLVAEGEKETTTYSYGLGLAYAEEGSDTYYYHYDHLGSTTVLTDQTGAVVATVSYGTYGELLGVTDQTNGGNLSMGTGALRFLYNAQYGVQTDANSLYYMRARYYSQAARRFINLDPVKGELTDTQSLNRYIYVQGNPVSAIDPLGLSPEGSIFTMDKHAILDILGYLPGIGVIADIYNAYLYAKEGNWFMAACSAVGAIPAIGGGLAAGAKALSKAGKVARTTAQTIKTITTAMAIGSQVALTGYQFGQSISKAIDEQRQNGTISGDTLKQVLFTGAAAAISTAIGVKALSRTTPTKVKDTAVGTGKSGATKTTASNTNVFDADFAACFTAGTLIKTADGSECIEEIEVGDFVYAKNAETGETGYKKVVRLFRNEVTKLVHLQIGGAFIDTTEKHPFWVDGYGFKSAGELEAGDYVETATGELLPVERVVIEQLKEPVTVYNLEVEDWHTYYVSDEEIFVHNMCAMPKKSGIPSKEISGTSYDINKLKKTQPYTYPDGVEKYKNQILSDGPNSIEPIPIRIHNGEALIVDGHHRYEAFMQLGYERVPIKYLHKSNLGKSLPNGDYYRTLEQLLRDKMN